jgi:hypothetical protein
VELSSFCSPATVVAVVLILAVSGWFSDAGAAAEGKSRRKDRQRVARSEDSGNQPAGNTAGRQKGAAKDHPLDRASLRYLPDNCQVLAQIDFESLQDSVLGRKLLTQMTATPYPVPPLDLRGDQIERMVIGARVIGDAEDSQYVTILFSKKPIAVFQSNPTWVTEEVDGRTLSVKGGEDPMAVSVVEGNIALVGYPPTVRAVLKRDGPTALPEALKRARRQLDPNVPAVVTALSDVELIKMSSEGIPASYKFVEWIEAVNVEIEPKSDLAVRAHFLCRNETGAQQFHGLVCGLWALLQAQGVDSQDPSTREVLQSLEFNLDGSVVEASVKVPSEVVNVVSERASTVPLSPVGGPAKPAKPAKAIAPSPASPPAPPTTNPPVSQAQIFNPHAGHVTPPVAPSYPPSPYGSSSVYPNVQPSVWTPEARPTLQIDDVVRMSEAGVDEAVVIRHIGKHQLASALTADDLILLTEKGVTTTVITTLQGLPCEPKPKKADEKAGAAPGGVQPPGTFLKPLPAPGREPQRVPEVHIPSSAPKGQIKEWPWTWLLDGADNHATPVRTHGGIL